MQLDETHVNSVIRLFHYIDNALSNKLIHDCSCTTSIAAAVVFQYFIRVFTRNASESEIKKIRRAKANMNKYSFITPNQINTQTSQLETGSCNKRVIFINGAILGWRLE